MISRLFGRKIHKGVFEQSLPSVNNPLFDPFERAKTPWEWDEVLSHSQGASLCNICWWGGDSFIGGWHSEAAQCPACGSVARDRFLFYCFIQRTPPGQYRVLETSPRLGKEYRRAMKQWFDYRASDFDLRSHRADLRIDLQDISLEGNSVDVLLTPHVLEHVDDTDRALSEIRRVLAPGGRMYLQVPILQGETARPKVPEFHGDNTAVEWRFGPDLTARLRRHGFKARILCTGGFHQHVENGTGQWPDAVSPEFNVESILAALRVEDLHPVADDVVSRRLGFQPSYMFLTWECLTEEES